jgi:hypothetical protein
MSDIQNVDINFIDKALAASNRECEITYGYYGKDSELSTVTYSGTIMDYTVEVRDNALFYTITGFSSIVRLIERRGTYGSGYTNPEKPTNVVRDLFEKELAPLGYRIEIEKSSNDDIETEIEEVTDTTLFQYADTLLKMARCSSESEDIRPEEMTIYGYVVSDTNPKTITIKKFDPKTKNNPVFVFNWMDTTKSGGNIVIDFRTELRGIMLMAKSHIDENKEDFSAINLRGDVVPIGTDNIQSPVNFEENNNDKTAERSTWARAIQHSYKATLKLVGIPYDVPIGTCIKIVPLILGKVHHTSGVYMILKSTDIIDPSGFTTTFELLKLTENK